MMEEELAKAVHRNMVSYWGNWREQAKHTASIIPGPEVQASAVTVHFLSKINKSSGARRCVAAIMHRHPVQLACAVMRMCM